MNLNILLYLCINTNCVLFSILYLPLFISVSCKGSLVENYTSFQNLTDQSSNNKVKILTSLYLGYRLEITVNNVIYSENTKEPFFQLQSLLFGINIPRVHLLTSHIFLNLCQNYRLHVVDI